MLLSLGLDLPKLEQNKKMCPLRAFFLMFAANLLLIGGSILFS